MAKLSRACDLAKADLVTNMVYEFSDVQGIMGREYARKAGEPEEVALAIYEQYLPRYAGDELPSQMGGALLGIGERLDTLSAIYKIGMEPTSSQDPYGLRRAARTINELIWGLSLDIDLDEALGMAAELLEMPQERLEKLKAFIAQRQQVQLREKGFSHEAVALAVQTAPSRPLQLYRLAEVLTKAAGEPWFAELVTAAVRVKNLLAKAEGEPGKVDPRAQPLRGAREAHRQGARSGGEVRLGDARRDNGGARAGHRAVLQRRPRHGQGPRDPREPHSAPQRLPDVLHADRRFQHLEIRAVCDINYTVVNNGRSR